MRGFKGPASVCRCGRSTRNSPWNASISQSAWTVVARHSNWIAMKVDSASRQALAHPVSHYGLIGFRLIKTTVPGQIAGTCAWLDRNIASRNQRPSKGMSTPLAVSLGRPFERKTPPELRFQVPPAIPAVRAAAGWTAIDRASVLGVNYRLPRPSWPAPSRSVGVAVVTRLFKPQPLSRARHGPLSPCPKLFNP